MTSNHGPATARLFRPGDVAVLRLATLPADAASTYGNPPALDDATAMTGYLRRLADDPVLHEAIAVSSHSLADTLERIRAGEQLSPKKLRRATVSVTRYVLRTTGRPTPFGLHAGVAAVRAGEPARVRIGSDPTKHARPDAGWRYAVLRDLVTTPGELDDVRVCVNNLCQRRGDRLVLSYPRGEAGHDGAEANSSSDPRSRAREVSVALGPAVAAVLHAARRPIAYADLRDLLLRQFAQSSTASDQQASGQDSRSPNQAVEQLLTGLIDRDILMVDEHGLDSRVDPDHRIARTLKDYENTAVGDGRAAWRTAVDALQARHHTDRPPVHVDLRLDADVRLPTEVFGEAARAASALWRMSPELSDSDAMSRYHGEFLERYGTDRVVPVTEVLDPHRGLGPPAGYRNLRRSGPPSPGPSPCTPPGATSGWPSCCGRPARTNSSWTTRRSPSCPGRPDSETLPPVVTRTPRATVRTTSHRSRWTCAYSYSRGRSRRWRPATTPW